MPCIKDYLLLIKAVKMDLKKYQSQLNNIQTPCYVYDLNLLEQTLLACKNAADQYNFEVHYAFYQPFKLKILEQIV